MKLWVLPELHFDSPRPLPPLEKVARALDDSSFRRFAELAQELDIWLVPGSFYERGSDGHVYNTALVFSPAGQRIASYRKIFPWRPMETTAPGAAFEVFELAGYGHVGISICYDIWFPEHTRHLAWMGADLILNLVQTATSDREQETAIVQGNATMNQVWIASVNAASPTGRGRSLVVDPNGSIRASSPDASGEILTVAVDFAQVEDVRRIGSGGVSRPWAQLAPGDRPIQLPLYAGELSPDRWASPPASGLVQASSGVMPLDDEADAHAEANDTEYV
jgi:predicted amidohydrolase